MKYLLCSLILILTVAAASQAQIPSPDGIQGTGEAIVEKKPDVMRMQVDLLAKGKDLADAIAQLKARHADVKKQLDTLGAVQDSIQLGEIEVGAKSERQLQMERMLRQRMAKRRGEKSPLESDAAASVTVSQSLTAEWPLVQGETSDMLLSTKQLCDSIKAADLAGVKAHAEPTPEEAELEEEMEGMASEYGIDGPQSPGEPAFVFVSRLTDNDRQKALTQAFAQAKREATELAQAAELELGAIKSLSSTSGLSLDDNDEYRQFSNSPFQMSFRQQLSGQDRSGEVLGASPGPQKIRIQVHVSYSVK